MYLSRDDLVQIITSPIPKMAFAAIIRKQTPVSRLCPFNTNQEASGAMFHGRRNELSTVVGELTTCVTVQGARRIGKTSLLKRGYHILRNRCPAEGRQRVHFFNCVAWSNYSHACHMLAHTIDPRRELRLKRAEQNIQYMLERCSHLGARPLYVFFDEVDRLIDFDSVNGWKFFNLMAWAKDAGMVRFVLAGYRSISRLLLGQNRGRPNGEKASLMRGLIPDTPLLLALEPLTLGPLARKDADALLAEPLKSTELQIQSEAVVLERVWKATTGYPFLIQFFGQHLFRRGVDRSPQYVTPDDVTAVEQGPELSEILESHFIENTQCNGVPVPHERGCAFLLAHSEDASWTEQDFWEACRRHGVPLGTDEMGTIHRAVKNLRDAEY